MESEGFDEEGGDDDGLIYDSRDFEEENQEGAWFDQFVARSLSEMEEGEGMEVSKEDKEKQPLATPRPVARPLQAPPANDVMMIEDSPVKVEVEDGEDVEMFAGLVVPPSNEASREERAAALRAQIKALEEEMEAAKSSPLPLLGL